MSNYTFECGCSCPIDESREPVFGRPSLIYNVEEMPLDCPATWDLISSGRTKGIFQLESSLGKAWAKRLKPRNIEHLAALLSLLRPGCLRACDERGVSMTEMYCRRKNGEESVSVDIDAVKSILEPTYGVMCIDQDALVSMANGDQKPIRLVRPGDMIHSVNVDTREAEIDECVQVGPTRREDGLRIILENGFNLIVTRDHEVLIYDGFRQAGNLCVGQDLVGVLHAPTRQYARVGSHWLGRWVDVAYLMGYLVGNGAMQQSTTLCVGAEHKADTLIAWMSQRLPLLRCRKYFHVRSWYVGVSCDQLTDESGYGNRKTRFRRFVEEYDLDHSCKDKVIPPFIMSAPDSLQFAFLAGLFDADGYGRTACHICTASDSVMEGVRHLAVLHGLCPYITGDRRHIHFFNSNRFAEVTAPYRLLREVGGHQTYGFRYGRVPRSVLHDLWRASGLKQSTFAAKYEMQPLTFASARLMHVPVEQGTAAKCGVDNRNVRFMRIKRIECVPDRQFYGISVRRNQNLVADGVVVHNCYQEQTMQIARDIAKFDLVEVDRLRKSIGKKDQDLLAKVGKIFIDKCDQVGIITREQAESLFDNIRKSGRYQFNKAHAVSYALDSYWTAHEKAHFPLFFFRAYLYYAKDKQDPLKEIRALVNEAKLFNIRVLPPRFSDLEEHFATDGVEITFGLADVKDIGEKKVKKMRAAMPAAEKAVGQPAAVWSWFDFLVYFAEHVDAVLVRRMIEVGALRHFEIDRVRLLEEYHTWQSLTDTEREKIAKLRDPLIKRVMVKEQVDVEVDDFDPEEMARYEAALEAALEAHQEEHESHDLPEPEHPQPIGKKTVKRWRGKRDANDKVIYEDVLDEGGEPVVLDPPRPVTNLTDALVQLLLRPGAVTKNRRVHVEGQRDMLINPPSPLKDTPFFIAKKEEEAMGLPLTVSHVDGADKSTVDTTCEQVRNGIADDDCVLGVEIQECRETTVKNGKNRGRKMAYMSVSDETGALDDLVIFSDAWEQYGNLLGRARTVVALRVRRDKKKGGLIVDQVWEI